ncbi:MAG: hypothetical protein M1829_003507 [Trizodia sp. TS-e1964]|nr:MAG: hypothetical protein M1829_003507 [Trizodia sp. TS-e1964]
MAAFAQRQLFSPPNPSSPRPSKGSPQLPDGICSYRNLSISGPVSSCGCQRFTKDGSDGGTASCMCGHHACFHSFQSHAIGSYMPQAAPLSPLANIFCQNSPATPFADKGPSSLDGLLPIPSQCLLGSQDNFSFLQPDDYNGLHGPSERVEALADDPYNAAVPEIPDITMDSLKNTQPDTLKLPPTDCSISSYEEQPGKGRDIQSNLDHLLRPQSRPGLANALTSSGLTEGKPTPILDTGQIQLAHRDDMVLSATEIATPSQDGSPNPSSLAGFAGHPQEFQTVVDKFEQELRKAIYKELQAPGDDQYPNNLGGGLATEAPELPASPRYPSALISSLHHLIPHLSSLSTHLKRYPALQESLQNHAVRIDAIENASYSNGPAEDLQEKLEVQDIRIIEVENKLDDLDKWRRSIDDDNSSLHGVMNRQSRRDQGSRHGVNSLASFASNNSVGTTTSSALIAATLGRSAYSRIDTLEAKISELQALAPPSAARPLEIEVVLLPWSQSLRGIWYPLADFPISGSTQASENWTESQKVLRPSRMQLDGNSPGGWNGTTIRQWASDTEIWMLPKACGQKSRVYNRLRSRGLVRNVQFFGNSASGVQAALEEAFSNVSNELKAIQRSFSRRTPTSVSFRALDGSHPLGLEAPFIPLRKIHRDDRLRFLTREEMLTSALWTTEFLCSSVAMRASAGQKRLFVTSCDAYLQHEGREHADYTWQTLRQLPRTNAIQGESETNCAHLQAGNAKEVCWEWDPKLDPPISTFNSSFSTTGTPFSGLSLRQQNHSLSVDRLSPTSSRRQTRSMTPKSILKQPPISPPSEYMHARPVQRRRTASMPCPRPGLEILPSNKHMIASHELSSPTKSLAKRRRVTRSPSFQPSIHRSNTPRVSEPPPSPFFSDAVMDESRSQRSIAVTLKRGGTPFAYATPHSGTIAVRNRRYPSDPNDDRGHPDEEAWEGVIDDETGATIIKQEEREDMHMLGITDSEIDYGIDSGEDASVSDLNNSS